MAKSPIYNEYILGKACWKEIEMRVPPNAA